MKTATALVLGLALGLSCRAASRPNIVMLFIDDWAWNGTPVHMDDGMPNSRMPIVQMPNLERLATEGMKFRNAYSGAPQCAPSRVCLQTGKSAPRSGYTVYLGRTREPYYDTRKKYARLPVVPNVSDMTIDADAVTIAEVLQPLGYASAHFGKWHMGGDPGARGYIAHDGNLDNKPGNQRIPGDPKLMFSITRRAVDFMRAQVEAKSPFYLQVSHYAMHEGRECLPETRKKYQSHPHVQAYYKRQQKTPDTINARQDPATWLGMAEDLDGRIGAVLDEIRALGIEDHTYVIVVSDNGYRHTFFPGLTQPLHGAKWWVWQGGLRVPMIVKGPDVRKGAVFDANVINYDFLPTFVEWAGGDLDRLEEIDGISLAGYLRGEKPDDAFRTRYLYFHYPHYRSGMPSSAIVSGTRKVMHFYERPDVPMLFDLAADEGEVENIAGKRPEEHQELFHQMMRYFRQVNARMPKVNPDYDPEHYQRSDGYDLRMAWGPFEGRRALEEDE